MMPYREDCESRANLRHTVKRVEVREKLSFPYQQALRAWESRLPCAYFCYPAQLAVKYDGCC
jgi:hypothetical protein